MLLGGGEPGEERHHLEGAAGVRLQVAEGVGGVPDLPLARQEHQHVTGTLVRELADGVHDRLGLVADDDLALVVHVPVVGRARRDQGSVADLDGVHPSGDLDDRGRTSTVVGEVPGEPLRVDGRRRDDQLQVGASRQQSPEVAEQEVDVEAPLVGLVDDDRVVAAELPVALELGEQDAVGHHLDPGVARRAIGEAHLVADLGAELRLQLRGQALGDRAGGDPSRLGVPDQSPATALSAAQLEADLRQLRGLPRAGLAGHDHDLVIPDRRRDVVAPAADRQLGREGDVHNDEDCLPPDGADPTEFRQQRQPARASQSGSGQANDTADPRQAQVRHRNRTQCRPHDPPSAQQAAPGRTGGTQRGGSPGRRRRARPDHPPPERGAVRWHEPHGRRHEYDSTQQRRRQHRLRASRVAPEQWRDEWAEHPGDTPQQHHATSDNQRVVTRWRRRTGSTCGARRPPWSSPRPLPSERPSRSFAQGSTTSTVPARASGPTPSSPRCLPGPIGSRRCWPTSSARRWMRPRRAAVWWTRRSAARCLPGVTTAASSSSRRTARPYTW